MEETYFIYFGGRGSQEWRFFTTAWASSGEEAIDLALFAKPDIGAHELMAVAETAITTRAAYKTVCEVEGDHMFKAGSEKEGCVRVGCDAAYDCDRYGHIPDTYEAPLFPRGVARCKICERLVKMDNVDLGERDVFG